MNTSPKGTGRVHMDAAVAGPLFMLAAALLYTLLTLQVKLIGPAPSAAFSYFIYGERVGKLEIACIVGVSGPAGLPFWPASWRSIG